MASAPCCQPPVATARVATAARAEAERLKISPIARKLAEEFGIDPAIIQGTGPGGRITKEDVLRVAEAPEGAPARQPCPGGCPGYGHASVWHGALCL